MEPYPDPDDEEEDEGKPYDPNDYDHKQERYEDMDRWIDPD